MYALSVIVYFGGAAAMLWSTWVAWGTARPVTARFWTVVLALSSLVLLYIALVYHQGHGPGGGAARLLARQLPWCARI